MLYIQEEWVNASEGYNLGSSEVYQTRFDDIGNLFRSLQCEYGRCISKVFIGNENPIAIGWVFEKRKKYDDCNKTFLLETWVTLHNEKPVKTITYDYKEL